MSAPTGTEASIASTIWRHLGGQQIDDVSLCDALRMLEEILMGHPPPVDIRNSPLCDPKSQALQQIDKAMSQTPGFWVPQSPPIQLHTPPLRTEWKVGAHARSYKRQEAIQRKSGVSAGTCRVWEHRHMVESMTWRHRHFRPLVNTSLAAAPMSFLHLRLSHTVDITAMATVVLAVGTLILAVSTRRAARATSIQASATLQQSRLLEQQLELDRRQLAEVHRPVIVTDQQYARTSVGAKHASVPVRNVGTGPALNLRLTVTFPGGRYTNQSTVAVLGVGDQTVLKMMVLDSDEGADEANRMQALFAAFFAESEPDIAVSFEYEGIGGEGYRTRANFDGVWHSLSVANQDV